MERARKTFGILWAIVLLLAAVNVYQYLDRVSRGRRTVSVLPQVYILGSAYYSKDDLEAIRNRIIRPVVNYVESTGQTVVAIEVDNDNQASSIKKKFLVSVFIDQGDADSNAGYLGFVHEKVGNEIPMWEPDLPPEGYQG